jgi:hypothetical protein
MLKSLAIVGIAATGGVLVSGFAAGKLDEMKFAQDWKPETRKAIAFGFTAASGAGLFAVLNRYV